MVYTQGVPKGVHRVVCTRGVPQGVPRVVYTQGGVPGGCTMGGYVASLLCSLPTMVGM